MKARKERAKARLETGEAAPTKKTIESMRNLFDKMHRSLLRGSTFWSNSELVDKNRNGMHMRHVTNSELDQKVYPACDKIVHDFFFRKSVSNMNQKS